MNAFRLRRINGDRRPGLNLFRDRLCFESRRDPLAPLDFIRPLRGHGVRWAVRLRNMHRKSLRRRLKEARQRPLAWEGTRCAK